MKACAPPEGAKEEAAEQWRDGGTATTGSGARHEETWEEGQGDESDKSQVWARSN